MPFCVPLDIGLDPSHNQPSGVSPPPSTPQILVQSLTASSSSSWGER